MIAKLFELALQIDRERLYGCGGVGLVLLCSSCLEQCVFLCNFVGHFVWQVMEFEVKSLLDTVNSIHDEMFYLRER